MTALRYAVERVLSQSHGATAREIARETRKLFPNLSKSEVNSLLYSSPHRFRSVDAVPPRWYLRTHLLDASEAVAAPKPLADQDLYTWQKEALQSWHASNKRGIVEAVTGAGKTRIGIAAAREELSTGGKVLVVVPTIELQRQWEGELSEHLGLPRIGLLGNGKSADLGSCDILIAVVNSLRRKDVRLQRGHGLLIADECHRYGAKENARALKPQFQGRLGLSATYARSDDGHIDWLLPYFDRVCFTLDYPRAIADDAVARFKVALVGITLSKAEKEEYDHLCVDIGKLRTRLIFTFGVPKEPFGEFMKKIGVLAATWPAPAGKTARAFLSVFTQRRELLAETSGKLKALAGLIGPIRKAERTLIFTQTIEGAEAAAGIVEELGVSCKAVHSKLNRSERKELLNGFGDGDPKVLVAPQILDEGIDVPAADFAIILAASKSERQMIQRMGRVLRRKKDGRLARFAILYAKNTSEDPSSEAKAHEAFLDRITAVAEEHRSFDAGVDDKKCVEYLDSWHWESNSVHVSAPDSMPRVKIATVSADQSFSIMISPPRSDPDSKVHSFRDGICVFCGRSRATAQRFRLCPDRWRKGKA
jgi:superfamily II DNA or RNA helicase